MDEVVALRFDEEHMAEDLAAWCGGEVARRADDQAVVILVPGPGGPKPAHVGDWIVRRDEGDYVPVDPEKFALLYAPADGTPG